MVVSAVIIGASVECRTSIFPASSSATASPIYFKFGMWIPYILVLYKKFSLHVDLTVDVDYIAI